MPDPEKPETLDQPGPDSAKSPLVDGLAAATGPFGQVPIDVTISVGRARPLVRDLINLTKDSILPLDRRIDDPVELLIGDRLIARGTLTELEGDSAGRLAVCLTEVADPLSSV